MKCLRVLRSVVLASHRIDIVAPVPRNVKEDFGVRCAACVFARESLTMWFGGES
jgi:hypothetical protein